VTSTAARGLRIWMALVARRAALLTTGILFRAVERAE
jgi:hypothetical protein